MFDTSEPALSRSREQFSLEHLMRNWHKPSAELYLHSPFSAVPQGPQLDQEYVNPKSYQQSNALKPR